MRRLILFCLFVFIDIPSSTAAAPPDCPPAFVKAWTSDDQGRLPMSEYPFPSRACLLHGETNVYLCEKNKGCSSYKAR